MKLYYILVPVLLIALISCTKSNEGKPSITIKSMTPGVVSRSDNFIVDLGFKEEGGFSLDSIFITMHRLNQVYTGTVNEFVSFSYTVPSYANITKGDMQLSFTRNLNSSLPNYAYLPDPPLNQNDTIRFSFYVKDFNNKTSDSTTASSNIIILSD
jgi:hypothetical protein